MMRTFLIAVKTNRGTWGSRMRRQAKSFQEYMEFAAVKELIEILERYKDEFKFMEEFDDPKKPNIPAK